MRSAPIAVQRGGLAGHPAVRAWRALHPEVVPEGVEQWRQRKPTKPAVYRLLFGSARPRAVFAKGGATRSALATERIVYERVLPRIPVTSPRYCGFYEAGDGWSWLFLEDVGDRRLSTEDPEELALAARWLGILHRAAAEIQAAARLPEAGPSRYLEHLRSARGQIRYSLGNPALSGADRALLLGVLGQLDTFESRWRRIARACEGLPRTLVHGDFRPKNVRVRPGPGGPQLYPIDWEDAGWGVPAVDLASARDGYRTLWVDPNVYGAVVRERWPELDAEAIRKLTFLGRIFRALASTDWACVSLVFETPELLSKPLAALRHYQARMAACLATAAEVVP